MGADPPDVGTTLWWAYLAGLAGILVLMLAVFFVTLSQKKPLGERLLSIIEGQDKKLSTSKFQWFVWTIAVVGGFSALFMARLLRGDTTDINIPSNVLLALGFSAVTMTTAKGITSAYVAGGKVDKSAPAAGGLLTDDDGIADLSKIQLMTWTVIAIAIWVYLVALKLGDIAWAGKLTKEAANLPDIPAALMVLMGLSQGGYLGKKLVTTDSFRLDVLVPSIAQPGDPVALFGAGFGNAKADDKKVADNPDSSVLAGGLKAATTSWTDGRIDFTVPARSPDGNAWHGTETVQVSVVISGTPSDKFLTLSVVAKA